MKQNSFDWLYPIKRGMTDGVGLISLLIASYLLLVLFFYSPNDAAWSTSGDIENTVKHPLAFLYGHFIADILFSSVGYAAYIIPIGILIIGFNSTKTSDLDIKFILINSSGILICTVALSIIFTFNITKQINSLAITGGGLIGQSIAQLFYGSVSNFSLMLVSFLLFFLGLTILAEINWFKTLHFIGFKIWSLFAKSNQVIKKDNKIANAVDEYRRSEFATPKEKQERLKNRLSMDINREPEINSFAIPTNNNEIINPLTENNNDFVNKFITPTYENKFGEPDTSFNNHFGNVANNSLSSNLFANAPPFNIQTVEIKEESPKIEATTENVAVVEKSAAEKEPLDFVEQERLHLLKMQEDVQLKMEQLEQENQRIAELMKNTTSWSAFAEAANTKENPLEKVNDSLSNDEIADLIDVSVPEMPKKITTKNERMQIRLPTQEFKIPVKINNYIKPPFNLLGTGSNQDNAYSEAEIEVMAKTIEEALANYRVPSRVMNIEQGPLVTQFELELNAGVKSSNISSLDKDLARLLSVPSVRVVEVIAGKPYVGLEVPNSQRNTVPMRKVLESRAYRDSKSPVTMVLGLDIRGEPVVTDLESMPHLLVAGTTGSGKSVGINVMIASMLYKSSPEQLRLILIDPKMLEMSVYREIPHLAMPVITDMRLAAEALSWVVEEMERRYVLMADKGVRKISEYNQKITTEGTLPNLVIVIDEFADLMMVAKKSVEDLITRIAQKARAAGIHLILATQRPSVDVITGLIKSNIPSRIAFQVASKTDSRTILDANGAESLLGHGDMLFMPSGAQIPTRVHGAFISDDEVNALAEFLRLQGKVNYLYTKEDSLSQDLNYISEQPQDGEADTLYNAALNLALNGNAISVLSLKRELNINHKRASELIEALRRAKIIE